MGNNGQWDSAKLSPDCLYNLLNAQNRCQVVDIGTRNIGLPQIV